MTMVQNMKYIPGDTTFTCDGAGHAIENIGDEDLVFMALILLDK